MRKARFSEDPAFEVPLRRAGIVDYESAMGYVGGHLVAAHRGRSVVRIEGTLYLKRFLRSRGEARRERRAMERLVEGPGPDPAPLAAWGEGPRGAFLVTAAPSGSLPLPEALEHLTGSSRRDLLTRLGERIRDLHGRHLVCPDLLAHHLLVALPDRVWLIDAGRLRPSRSLRARSRDLAALELSLPHGVAGRTDRVRFLRAVAGGDRSAPRRMLPRIRRAHLRLDRRSRHRTDRLLAARSDRRLLSDLGIHSFDDLHTFRGAGAERLRILPDRENWRVERDGRVFFVKRHRRVKGLMRTPAAAEWRAIDLFRRSGIRAMRPVALGEDVRKGSSIWVERAEGLPLDDLLRQGVSATVRRELVVEAAGILRRMRRHEIHHRDMYCCHLIADAARPAGERLTVIDLQRARRKRGLRSRWYVKDVAQLLHSAPRPPISGADLARFLRAYFDVPRLGSAERSFARRVRRKADRIARRGREPYERVGGGAALFRLFERTRRRAPRRMW